SSSSRTWCFVKKRSRRKAVERGLRGWSKGVYPSPLAHDSAPTKAVAHHVAVQDNDLAYPSASQQIGDYDASELARAKAHFFFGQWEELADLKVEHLNSHPDRGRLALLVAAAQQQLGNPEAARKMSRLAIAWGCGERLLAQVLIAGVHNTLGRASSL